MVMATVLDPPSFLGSVAMILVKAWSGGMAWCCMSDNSSPSVWSTGSGMSAISANIQLSAPVEVPLLKLLAACLMRSGVNVFLGVVMFAIFRISSRNTRTVSSQRLSSSAFQWPFHVVEWCFRISFGSLMYRFGCAGVVAVAGTAAMHMVWGMWGSSLAYLWSHPSPCLRLFSI